MKRGAVIGIVAAAVLVVAAGGAAAWFLTRPPSPEAVADQYLKALSKGDVSTIGGLLESDGKDLSSVESAFKGASGRISDYSVSLKDSAHGSQTATAKVKLDGKPGTVGFVLIPKDGAWKVTNALASLTATTTIGDTVGVGGAPMKAGTAVALLPAVYPVTASPRGLLNGESTAVVTNAKPVTVAVDATVSPDATTQAQQQLNAYADTCTKTAKAVPDNCGIRVPWAADLTALASLAYRIDAYPKLTISDDGRSFNAVGGKLVATATGPARTGGSGSFTYSADDWALRGDVSFSGDEMVLAVR